MVRACAGWEAGAGCGVRVQEAGCGRRMREVDAHLWSLRVIQSPACNTQAK